jgi:hypothetical protein
VPGPECVQVRSTKGVSYPAPEVVAAAYKTNMGEDLISYAVRLLNSRNEAGYGLNCDRLTQADSLLVIDFYAL